MLEKCNQYRLEGKRKVDYKKDLWVLVAMNIGEFQTKPNVFFRGHSLATAQKTGIQKNKYQELIFLLSSNFL